MIRCAKISEIPHILLVSKACSKAMKNVGIFQWNEDYPSFEAFNEDIGRNELYVLIADKKVIGSITISTKMDDDYLPIEWLTPSSKNIYIHRLCVHPNKQGKGYARQLMDYAEKFALENGYDSIRLDTFSQNKRNQKFYEIRGYKRVGDIYLPKQSEHPFHCYELVL